MGDFIIVNLIGEQGLVLIFEKCEYFDIHITITKSMKSKFLFLFIAMWLLNTQIKAHDSISIKGLPFSIKIAGARVNGTPLELSNRIESRFRPQLGLSLNYQFIENLNTGVYVAYANPARATPHFVGTGGIEYEATKSDVWYYGLNVSYDILPVLLHSKRIRFELYPILSAGHVSEKWVALESGIPGSATFFEYGGGVGLGFKFNKHISIFSETMFGKYYNYGKMVIRGGIKFSF